MDRKNLVILPFLPLKLRGLGLADVIKKYTANRELGDYPSQGLLVNFVDRMVWLLVGGISTVSRAQAGIILNGISKEENIKMWQQIADTFRETAERLDEAKKDSAVIGAIHLLESLDKLQVMHMRELYKEVFLDFAMWIEAELNGQESSVQSCEEELSLLKI